MRRLVLASGILLFIAGASAIGMLGIAVSGRAILAIAWMLVFLRQSLSLRRAYSRNGILTVKPGGEIRCRRCDGSWAPLEILPGSIVTSRWAWLRLRAVHTPDYAELLRGETRRSEDWRRFQVIWRHIGAA